MALTSGAWSKSTVTVAGKTYYMATCNVVWTGNSHNDAFTLKTPTGLNTSKPFQVYVNEDADTIDGSAVVVDLWGGFSSSFALAGDGASVTATDGFEIKPIEASVKATSGNVLCDPTLQTADVTDVHVKIPVLPYYAFNLDGGSTMAETAKTCDFRIIQEGNR